MYRPSLALLLLLLLAGTTVQAQPWVGKDLSSRPCTGKGQGFGPYDYTDPSSRKRSAKAGGSIPIQVVEQHHFGSHIEKLAGKPKRLAYDIDYTLRAFPNHHRALHAMARLFLKTADQQEPVWQTPPECYFQRAIAFRKRDAVVHMLFGIYLQKKGETARADKEYGLATKLSPTYAEAHYNYGLFLLGIGEYERAREQARLAYRYGYPLQGLKKKLAKAGHPL